MSKKIYFAGSIRGGRVDAGLYRQVIDFMKGKGHTVLTEHVGNSGLCLEEQGRDRDARIYEQDVAWLRESDLVIAECTCPSLGVGYELAYAEHRGIPVHIFYNRARCQLSAMLTGNSYFHLHPYETIDDLLIALEIILQQ